MVSDGGKLGRQRIAGGFGQVKHFVSETCSRTRGSDRSRERERALTRSVSERKRRAKRLLQLILWLVFAATLAQAADRWVATWAASPSPAMPDAAQMRRRGLEFNDQTVRQIVHISIGGERFRIRLSNAFGAQAVTVEAAHLALRSGGPKIASSSDRTLTFSGRPGITIPPGALVLSDPVDLKAPPAADLAVSLYLPGGPVVPSTVHYSAMQTSYAAAGNLCGAEDLPGNSTISSWPFLTGVDVMAPQKSVAIVTLGNSITDGSRSTSDTNRRWPDILAGRLLAQHAKTKLAVVNAGIGGNRILHDGAGAPGPSFGPGALSRFERDVLAQPGVRFVIVLEGVNDIGHPGGPAPMSEDVTADDIIAGLRQLGRAHEHGLKIFGGTIMPFTTAPSPKEGKRQAVNEWIRTGKAFDSVIDFDKVVRDPNQPIRFLAAYNSGDHLHPNDAGHKTMGEAVDLALFK
jgi:lysophospholipase L1-like esterase